MKSITKIILGLVGVAIIGLVTYYFITKKETNAEVKKETKSKTETIIKKPVTNPNKDTVAIAKVIQDTIKLDQIKKELGIDGQEFTLTEDEGVYINSTKDKLLIIKEDIWKKILRKAQKKFPDRIKGCNKKFKMPNLSKYKFVGLIIYLADTTNFHETVAYGAAEIRNGKVKYFAGGNACCDCGGKPLVPQQADAVIIE